MSHKLYKGKDFVGLASVDPARAGVISFHLALIVL